MCIASSSGATPSRSSRTSCCAAEGDGLRLKATDLDIEVTETIPADVARRGATTVPAHVIYDIVRKLPDGAQVSLEMTGETGQMQIRSGRSRFMLQALPESDFPDLAAGDLPHRFALPAADLKRLIEKTQFAISTEETRYYLNGIYLHTLEVDGQPRCCAPSPPTATASPGSRCRRPQGVGRHAGRDRAAQGRRRDPEARRGRRRDRRDRAVPGQGPPDLRRRRADLQAHRRHLPGLPARHPGRQRQAARRSSAAISPRRSTASRRSRPSAAAP